MRSCASEWQPAQRGDAKPGLAATLAPYLLLSLATCGYFTLRHLAFRKGDSGIQLAVQGATAGSYDLLNKLRVTLKVFGFYLNGGGPNLDNKDPLLVPLQVPPQAAGDLINFVSTALTDPRVAQGLPPFTRPTLRSELMPQAGFVYGPGSPGTGGRIPTILAEVPANVGNPDFEVGVANARGGALATFVLNVLLVRPERMSAWNLYSYSHHLKENRQKALRYEIALWSKVMYPLAVFVMMLLAVPFSHFQRRQGGVDDLDAELDGSQAAERAEAGGAVRMKLDGYAVSVLENDGN